MAGWGYIALAALILLLLPAVVMPWEGRRVPDALYGAIALAGLLVAGMKGGSGAMAWAVCGAIATLAIAVAAATAASIAHKVRLLTAGHIKLLSAGAVWLGPVGALAMVLAAFAALFAAGIVQRRRPGARRPDFTAIAALAILSVTVQQSLAESPAERAAVAAAEPAR